MLSSRNQCRLKCLFYGFVFHAVSLSCFLTFSLSFQRNRSWSTWLIVFCMCTYSLNRSDSENPTRTLLVSWWNISCSNQSDKQGSGLASGNREKFFRCLGKISETRLENTIFTIEYGRKWLLHELQIEMRPLQEDDFSLVSL